MNPIRLFTAVALLMIAAPFALADEAQYILSGPSELHQHTEVAKAASEKFMTFFYAGQFKQAADMAYIDYDAGRALGKKPIPRFSKGVLEHRQKFLKPFGAFSGRTLKRVHASNSYQPMADAIFFTLTYSVAFEKKASDPQKVVVRISDQGKAEIVAFN
jgi:hypothetical protein